MSVVWTGAAALAGAAVLHALRLPAGALIGGMLGVALLNLAGPGPAQVSPSGRFLLLAGLGWVAGQQFTSATLVRLRAVALPAVVIVMALVIVGALIAWGMYHVGVLDAPTAFLAASPGGLTQMAALGTATRADVPLVVAVHLLRVLAIFLLTPLVLVWLD